MWGLNYLFRSKDHKQHLVDLRPRRTGVPLNLEALEERWLPNGALAPTATPPPSFIQAAVTLYIDGIRSGAFLTSNFAAFQEDFATASTALRLYQFLGNTDFNSIRAEIAFMEPYAAPFGPLFVQAGELAVDQFFQQLSQPAPSPGQSNTTDCSQS